MTFLPMLSRFLLLLVVVSVTVSVVLLPPLLTFFKLVVVVSSTISVSVIYSSNFSGKGCPAMPISSTLSISVYLIFLSKRIFSSISMMISSRYSTSRVGLTKAWTSKLSTPITSSSETGLRASSKLESSATTKSSQVVLAAMLISSMDSSSKAAFSFFATNMSSITSATNSERC